MACWAVLSLRCRHFCTGRGMVHSPTYTGFTSVLNNNGRRAVHTELKRDAEGIWRMDYEDMEKDQKNHIHLAIFCSPHNRADVSGNGRN